jgi:hypothetical protein
MDDRRMTRILWDNVYFIISAANQGILTDRTVSFNAPAPENHGGAMVESI